MLPLSCPKVTRLLRPRKTSTQENPPKKSRSDQKKQARPKKQGNEQKGTPHEPRGKGWKSPSSQTRNLDRSLLLARGFAAFARMPGTRLAGLRPSSLTSGLGVRVYRLFRLYQKCSQGLESRVAFFGDSWTLTSPWSVWGLGYVLVDRGGGCVVRWRNLPAALRPCAANTLCPRHHTSARVPGTWLLGSPSSLGSVFGLGPTRVRV